MNEKKFLKNKQKNIVLESKFPETDKERELPLPSLEDIKDSAKTEFFSFEPVNKKDETDQ